jgi:hypothetical protein
METPVTNDPTPAPDPAFGMILDLRLAAETVADHAREDRTWLDSLRGVITELREVVLMLEDEADKAEKEGPYIGARHITCAEGLLAQLAARAVGFDMAFIQRAERRRGAAGDN